MSGLVKGQSIFLFQNDVAFPRVLFGQAIGGGKSHDAAADDADVAFHVTL